MLSERQRIEAPAAPAAENSMPPPPSYEEVSGVFASETYDGSTDNVNYFLGEVTILFADIFQLAISVSFSVFGTIKLLTICFLYLGCAFV